MKTIAANGASEAMRSRLAAGARAVAA